MALPVGFIHGLPIGAEKDPLVQLNMLTVGQLHQMASDDPPPVVHDLFMEETVNLLVGDSGLGKTPLLAQLAICVATGIPFLGLPTVRNRVLYCDAETASSHFNGYVRNISSFLRISPPKENLFFYLTSCTPFPEEPEPFELNLKRKMAALAPRLVIIDCLRPFFPGAESKSKDAMDMMAALRALALEHHAAIVVVHHIRKEKKDPKLKPPSLEANPREWLDEAAGSKALINHVTCRLGIDQAKASGFDEETYCLTGYSKHEGNLPRIYFTRIYDEKNLRKAIGYGAAVQRFTQEQADLFNALPDLYGFSELFELRGKKNRNGVANLLRAYVAAGLAVQQGEGNRTRYVKQQRTASASV